MLELERTEEGRQRIKHQTEKEEAAASKKVDNSSEVEAAKPEQTVGRRVNTELDDAFAEGTWGRIWIWRGGTNGIRI